eukprot:gb/GECH01008990.1/.p1 GENE.gb/GECH01008990.1/~~gb/GECH01008990.1/.p1  ORF type:complete len:936 (+),score=-5.28 gb/GECH01008990.1/:1-2808(+)
MRRISIVLFALFASMLVVSAAPASAADGDLVVGSEHTTDTDFQDATELTNVSVAGSGDSANLVFTDGQSFFDSFENQAADSGIPDGWSQDTAYWVPDAVEVSSTYATDGAQSVYIGDLDGTEISRLQPDLHPITPTTDAVSTDMRYASADDSGGSIRLALSEGGIRVALVQFDGDTLVNYDGAEQTITSVPSADEWVSVRITDIDPVTDTFTVEWETASDNGTVTGLSMWRDMSSGWDTATLGANDGAGYFDDFAHGVGSSYSGRYISSIHNVSNPSEGRVDLSLDNATADVVWQAESSGTWTNVSSATYTTGGIKSADLSSTSADRWRVRVDFETSGSEPTAEIGRDAVYFAVSTPDISAGTASPSGGEVVRYSTPTLSVDVSDDDLGTAQGEELTLTWRVDGSVVDTTTRSSNGTASITAPSLSDGNHTWSVTVDDSYGETVSSSTVSFDVQHFEPDIDNTSLSPADGTILDTRSPTISVDVSDGDFANDGDQLTAEFIVNNESVGTDTLTSNGTASFNFEGAVGGENTVFVRVTDQYGQTVQSQTNTFSVPSNLTIYNESSPTQKLTNLSEPVTLRFYYENGSQGQVIERTTSDGTISLEGLPVDQSFVVVADAPGYLPRRIFVGSLLERQSIYLLNESTEHVDNLITLSDYSGQFDKSETVLIVQRSLNGSWETVQGDYFGATGEYSAQLAYNVRHRLVLRNTRTGQEKVVGSYTPLASGTKSIQVMQDGDVQLALDAPRIVFGPSVRSLSAVSNTQVITSVENQSSDLTSWSVEVVYRNATTQERLFMTNETSATGGTISPSLDLSGRAGGNVTVIVNWTTAVGESGSKTETFFVRESFTNEYGLLPVLGQVDSMLPAPNLDSFTTFISLIVSVLVATGVARAFPASTELVGVSAVGTLAFFSIIDWVGIPIVFVSSMALIAFAALRRGL